MAKNSGIVSIIIPALIGGALATVACIFFFYFYSRQAALVDERPTPSPTTTPAKTTPGEIPNPEIKAADVSSVSIDTVYPGYFATGHKCAKTYNEYFGNEDGIASSGSPCTIKVIFDRDGRATRSVVISRWDKTAKEKRVVERTDSTAQISPEEFAGIAHDIVSNEAFKNWRDGTMINVSNCTISVTHAGGTKSPMSNLSDKTTAYLPMVEAFKRLEKQLAWK